MHKRWIKTLTHQKGAISLFMVISLPFMIILAAFTIDTGRAYIAKTKLFAAVDAAGIAAARVSSLGEAAAKNAAQRYFQVNFPSDYLDTSAFIKTWSFSVDEWGKVTVDLTGQANMPTILAKLVGIDTWTLTAESQTTRRTVDISLVVDNSSSLSGVFDTVKTRSKEFLSHFNPTYDRVAVTKYGYGAQTVVAFDPDVRQYDADAVEKAIDDMSYNNNYTNTAEGFYRGYEQFSVTGSALPANLKVIVLFTDGAPNTFSANFDIDGVDNFASISTTGSAAKGLWGASEMASRISYNIWNDYQNKWVTKSASNNSEDIYRYVNISSDDSYASFPLLGGPRAGNQSYDENTQTSNSHKSKFQQLIRGISRDLPEKMAYAARADDIYIFTLGLGSSLTSSMDINGSNVGTGEDMLYRMANDARMGGANGYDALLYPQLHFQANQTQGLYCYAEDERDLGPCFDKILDFITRLTL
ncbi:hypothetical protein VHA01S_023_00170 [Vibrio halioticoli NBRC 102217]|uniref:VWFA domain-containing protein n=1 Tax=Vibrio halioticoli NBRC 102217 TaxID=1219072 RepID=V5FDD3_9VIBR|nr:vWA domain-containing protein [Vibrio halioticoli]GAD89603.1 hypothetical protein VHA01S_023_00170 [Vibrio halioticoli NBRC 102217]